MKWTSYFDETHELVGWAGALAVLLAYALGSFGVLLPGSAFYQALNVFGSFGLIYNTWKMKAYPSVVLNAIWALIGGLVLLGLVLR